MYKLNLFWVLLVLTLFSWGSWYIILHNISPIQSELYAFISFYSSSFLAITFTVSLLFSLLWKMIIPTKSSYICLKNGIRFGMIVGLLSIIALIFQQNNALGQMEILTMIALGVLIEIINIINTK